MAGRQDSLTCQEQSSRSNRGGIAEQAGSTEVIKSNQVPGAGIMFAVPSSTPCSCNSYSDGWH